MAVEGRFICTRKDLLDQVSVVVQLTASITGQDNKTWAPFTPAGSITMTVTGTAAGEFVQGQRYRLVLEPVGDHE